MFDNEKLCDWPISYLQDKTMGIFTGDLILVGAGSGCGKSTLSRLITMSAKKQGVPVVLYSLENQPGTFVREETRMAYNADTGSCINERAFKQAHHDNPARYEKYRRQVYEESNRATESGLKLFKLHESVSDSNWDVNKVIHSMSEEYEQGYRLFIIDHIDMLITDPRNELTQTYSNMNKLWAFVASKNIALITFSQLAGSMREGVLAPSDEDLRGSKTKGQRATAVITLSRHDYGYYILGSNPHAAPTYVRLAKFRDGKTGCAIVFFENGEYIDYYQEILCNKTGTLVDGLNQEQLVKFKIQQGSKK